MEKILVSLSLLLSTLWCSAQPLESYVKTTSVMGTSLKIQALGSSERVLEKSVEAAFTEIKRVEDLMTTWRPSPMMDLMQAAGKGPVEVPHEIALLTSRSKELHRLTGGAFDISYAAVGKLWNFKAKPPVVPDPESVTKGLAFVGADRIQVALPTNTVTLPEGMSINLGGIAKGYGVDRAMRMMQQAGIKHGMVNAGGDMKALGMNNGKPWEVAIKHPRDRERAIAVIRISNQCMVTSGDYERFFEKDGRRYHHIIDPRTGYPATGCMSATVVGFSAEFSDALATALCIMKPEAGLALIEKLPRMEALLVDMDGKVHASTGLQPSLKKK